MKYLVLLFAALGACLSASAQDDGIHAKLMVVRTELIANWNKEDAPPLGNVTEAKRGDDLKAVVFFTGQARDAKGNAKVTYTITIETPKGEKFVQKDLVGAEGVMPKEIASQMYLGSAKVSAKLPPDHPSFPPGKYKFRATVTDNVAMKTWDTEEVVVDLK